MSEKNCNTCKSSPLGKTEYKLAIAGLYLFATSIYGTYHLVLKIISLLN
jgi:hypothetical protein